MKTLNVPILFFFISIFVSVACTGTDTGTINTAPVEDMAHQEDILYIPFPTGSGGGGGKPDKCIAADCNSPLDKRPEFSDPSRGPSSDILNTTTEGSTTVP